MKPKSSSGLRRIHDSEKLALLYEAMSRLRTNSLEQTHREFILRLLEGIESDEDVRSHFRETIKGAPQNEENIAIADLIKLYKMQHPKEKTDVLMSLLSQALGKNQKTLEGIWTKNRDGADFSLTVTMKVVSPEISKKLVTSCYRSAP